MENPSLPLTMKLARHTPAAAVLPASEVDPAVEIDEGNYEPSLQGSESMTVATNKTDGCKSTATTMFSRMRDYRNKSSRFASLPRFLQFEDEEVERRYLHFLSTHSLSLDARLFYLAGLVLTIQIQVSRGQQCEELATDPCPVAFWALRVVTALWVLLVALLLTFLLASKSTRSAMMPRYQELLLTCAVVSFVLELIASSMKELHTRYEKRCVNNPEMCPNFNWYWGQIVTRSAYSYYYLRSFSLTLRYSVVLAGVMMLGMLATAVPWGTDEDDDGNHYDLNHFEPGGVVMGYMYISLTILLSLRCKHLHERLSRQMFRQTQHVISQQTSIKSLLEQYTPSRFGEIGKDNLVMEEFPVVTMLFCSFDQDSVEKYSCMHNAHDFFAAVVGIFLDFDSLLESTKLYKLENVGTRYVVASSVVTTGIVPSDPDTSEVQTKDAAALVELATEMVAMSDANQKINAMVGGGAIHLKVGMHSGPCVGAVAGTHRRIYKLFGEVVSVAGQMAARSEPGTIQLTEATRHYLESSDIQTVVTGTVIVNANYMNVYQVSADRRCLLVDPSGVSSPSTADTPISRSEELDTVHPLRSELVQLQGSRLIRCSSPLTDASGDECEQEATSDLSVGNDDEAGAAGEGSARADGHHLLRLGPRLSCAGMEFLCKLFSAAGKDWNSYAPGMPTNILKAIKPKSQHHWLSGRFVDTELEDAFQVATRDDLQREHKLLLTMVLSSMLFFHIFVFVQAENIHNKRYHLWILVICGTGMLHQTWTLWRLNKRKPICFYTRRQRMFWRAIAVASILLVPLVLLTPSWYSKLGFMLLLLHYPTYSSSSKTLAAGALCLLMILVIPVVWLGESVRETTVGLLAILAIYLILLLLRQSFFIKSRIVWQVESELLKQRKKLGGLLFDMVPSVSACTYILEQHQRLRKTSIDGSCIRRSDSDMLMVVPLGNTACVLSTDMVGFGALASRLGARDTMRLLHDVWSIMDGSVQAVQALRRKDSLSTIFSSMESTGHTPNSSEKLTTGLSNVTVGGESTSRINIPGQDTGSKFEKRGSSLSSSHFAGLLGGSGISRRMIYSVEAGAPSGSFMRAITPFKVDTVGDTYVVAVMLEHPGQGETRLSVMRMMKLAQSMVRKVLEYSKSEPYGTEPGALQIRMGLSAGPAVSGLVGLTKPRYYIAGEAMYRAKELESSSSPYHVHLDESTARILKSLDGNRMVDLTKSDWRGEAAARVRRRSRMSENSSLLTDDVDLSEWGLENIV